MPKDQDLESEKYRRDVQVIVRKLGLSGRAQVRILEMISGCRESIRKGWRGKSDHE